MQLQQKQNQNYFQKVQVSKQSTPAHGQDPFRAGSKNIWKLEVFSNLMAKLELIYTNLSHRLVINMMEATIVNFLI